jgi:hypothetical protein
MSDNKGLGPEVGGGEAAPEYPRGLRVVSTRCRHCHNRQATVSPPRHSPLCRVCKRPMTDLRTWAGVWGARLRRPA